MSADRPISAAERLDRLDAVCDALAHPARRQILLTVHFRGGAMAAGDIAGRFAHAWPTTTRHLKVLEAAGLLASERVGRAVVYRTDRACLGVLREWLAWFDEPAPPGASAGPETSTPVAAVAAAATRSTARNSAAKRSAAKRSAAETPAAKASSTKASARTPRRR